MSLYSVRMADRWRSAYNPLRGLTMSRVVRLLEEGERGAYADLQWVYRMIEKRDATLRGLKRKLASALTKLDWDVKIRANLPDNQQRLAEAQREALRADYEAIANLKEALEFLALAEFRGYAHLEVITGAASIRLELIPQWHWCRDGIYGAWQFNEQATSGLTGGEAVDPRRLIVREVDDPVDEIALIAFVRKGLCDKDWDGFIETYGIPPLFGVMPPNVPVEDRDKWQETMEQVVGDSRGVIPNGGDVKTVGDSTRGIQPFEGRMRYQDEQIVLAGTSGKLTMLAGATGMNSGVADAQSDTFDEIAVAQAGKVSEVMQAQFDSRLLARQFPGQPVYAYFELAAKEEADVDAEFDRAGKATAAGYHIPASELGERTGYKIEDAPTPQGGQQGMPGLTGGMFNRDRGDAADESAPEPVDREQALAALEEAYASDMSGALETIQPFLDAYAAATTPQAAQAALKKLAKALDGLPAQDAGKTGELLSRILGQQFLQGAEDTARHFNGASTPKGVQHAI